MKALGMSFVYAIRGIFYCLHHERNMRIHFVCMAYMYFFLLGFDFFQLSRTQFAIIFLANAAVIMGELINTAVERTVDLHSKGKHPLAKAAKDTAAGAVLVAAIGAVAAGVALLWQPPAFRALYQYYASHPGSLALFAASLVFSFAYIFIGTRCMMIHESTQKLKKAWFRGHTNAKCEPQVMARKQFFAGLLQNILFCNSPLICYTKVSWSIKIFSIYEGLFNFL